MHRSTPRRPRWLLAAGLSALALLGSACGSSDSEGSAGSGKDPSTTLAGIAEDDGLEALVEAAKAEGKVTVYSSHSQASLDQVKESFEKAYPGITVEIFRGVDADIQTKVEAELKTGKPVADLVIGADKVWWDAEVAKDAFLPLEGPELAGEGEYDADQYVHEGNIFEINAAALTYAWNTTDVPDGVDGYLDLLDPKYADGKLGVIEPSAGSIVDFYWWLQENFGDDYLEKLAAQKPRIYPSALPIGEALMSGEIIATPYAAPVQLIPAKADGAPIDFGIAEEGAWGARYFGGILKDSTHPKAAQLLANFFVTQQAQEAVATGAGSTLASTEGAIITQDKVRIMDLERLTPENISAFQAEWDKLFR